jgi:hypothetical protein
MGTQHKITTDTERYVDFNNLGIHLVTTKSCASLKLIGILHVTVKGWKITIRKTDQDSEIYKGTADCDGQPLSEIQKLGMVEFDDIMKDYVEEWAKYKDMRPKNTLIVYEGGGYDGCFWEPNALLFDKNGKFVSIHHSGYKGIKTESLALQLAATKENPLSHYGNKKDTEIVDLTNDEQVEEWQRNNNEGFVVGICEEIKQMLGNNEIELDAEPWFECDVCNNRVENGVSDGPEGAGGIAIVNTEKICHDCHSINTCSTCGQFRINTEEYQIRVAQDLNGMDYCCWCIDDVSQDEIDIPLSDELIFEDTYKIKTDYPVVGLTVEGTVNQYGYTFIIYDKDENILESHSTNGVKTTEQLQLDLTNSVMPLNDIKWLAYNKIKEAMRNNFDEAIENIYK